MLLPYDICKTYENLAGEEKVFSWCALDLETDAAFVSIWQILMKKESGIKLFELTKSLCAAYLYNVV